MLSEDDRNDIAAARRAMDEATAEIAEFDRTVLGVFAIEYEILVLRVAQEKVNEILWYSNTLLPEVDDVRKDIAAKLDAAIDSALPAGRDVLAELYGEVNYWFNKAIDPASYIKEWTEKLEIAGSHPTTFHPYFAAGIWDADAVARYVADDIDVEMALRLEAS